MNHYGTWHKDQVTFSLPEKEMSKMFIYAVKANNEFFCDDS